MPCPSATLDRHRTGSNLDAKMLRRSKRRELMVLRACKSIRAVAAPATLVRRPSTAPRRSTGSLRSVAHEQCGALIHCQARRDNRALLPGRRFSVATSSGS